jgi:undecaprenyl-diphosphatase
MQFWQAVVLGIVQGLTEFIPISSTAHLVFASRWVDLFQGEALRAEETTATIAVLQLGTLAAVIIYFARDIINITVAFVRDHINLVFGKKPADGEAKPGLSLDARLGWLVIIGSIPIGVVGLLFKKQIEGTFTKNLWVIATMMVVIAFFLMIAELVGKRQRAMDKLRVGDALIVGGSQVLALLPGASRSGSTIMGGLFAGLTRETAARFSFLLSMPAIAASGLLELKKAIEVLPRDSFGPLAVGTVVAGLVGYASIFFLLRYLKKHSTGVFIGYRFIVGGAILVLLAMGSLDPSISPNTTAKPAPTNAIEPALH